MGSKGGMRPQAGRASPPTGGGGKAAAAMPGRPLRSPRPTPLPPGASSAAAAADAVILQPQGQPLRRRRFRRRRGLGARLCSMSTRHTWATVSRGGPLRAGRATLRWLWASTPSAPSSSGGDACVAPTLTILDKRVSAAGWRRGGALTRRHPSPARFPRITANSRSRPARAPHPPRGDSDAAARAPSDLPKGAGEEGGRGGGGQRVCGTSESCTMWGKASDTGVHAPARQVPGGNGGGGVADAVVARIAVGHAVPERGQARPEWQRLVCSHREQQRHSPPSGPAAKFACWFTVAAHRSMASLRLTCGRLNAIAWSANLFRLTMLKCFRAWATFETSRARMRQAPLGEGGIRK